MTIDTGWRVALAGGPLSHPSRPLLGEAELEDPPERLAVYLCPCCNQITPMGLEDPRNVNMGRAHVLYELRVFSAPQRLAIYEVVS